MDRRWREDGETTGGKTDGRLSGLACEGPEKHPRKEEVYLDRRSRWLLLGQG